MSRLSFLLSDLRFRASLLSRGVKISLLALPLLALLGLGVLLFPHSSSLSPTSASPTSTAFPTAHPALPSALPSAAPTPSFPALPAPPAKNSPAPAPSLPVGALRPTYAPSSAIPLPAGTGRGLPSLAPYTPIAPEQPNLSAPALHSAPATCDTLPGGSRPLCP